MLKRFRFGSQDSITNPNPNIIRLAKITNPNPNIRDSEKKIRIRIRIRIFVTTLLLWIAGDLCCEINESEHVFKRDNLITPAHKRSPIMSRPAQL